MKFKVIYKRLKKKKIANFEVIFLEVEDAYHWAQHVKDHGYQDVEVMPVF